MMGSLEDQIAALTGASPHKVRWGIVAAVAVAIILALGVRLFTR